MPVTVTLDRVENPLFELFIKPNRMLFKSMIFFSNKSPHRPAASFSAHKEIVQGVAQGNSSEAERAMASACRNASLHAAEQQL